MTNATSKLRTRRRKAPAQAAAAHPESERISATEAIDQRFKANLARLTSGVSPAGVFAAYANWVAPWRSVYKITFCAAEDEVTFLLASGGHNTGTAAAPGDPRASYQVRKTGADEPYIDPSTWRKAASWVEGSWWPQWPAWLAAHSTARIDAKELVSLPSSLGEAPRTNVLLR